MIKLNILKLISTSSNKILKRKLLGSYLLSQKTNQQIYLRRQYLTKISTFYSTNQVLEISMHLLKRSIDMNCHTRTKLINLQKVSFVKSLTLRDNHSYSLQSYTSKNSSYVSRYTQTICLSKIREKIKTFITFINLV